MNIGNKITIKIPKIKDTAIIKGKTLFFYIDEIYTRNIVALHYITFRIHNNI